MGTNPIGCTEWERDFDPKTEQPQVRPLRPLEPLLPGETRSEYLARLERAQAGTAQQLVARIKRSSKYYGQTAPGRWFDVRVVNDGSYQLRGNDNDYRLSDVVLGMRTDAITVVNLANGKIEVEV